MKYRKKYEEKLLEVMGWVSR